MILDRVTLTGADDSVDPADLLKLSEEFSDDQQFDLAKCRAVLEACKEFVTL